MNKFLLTGLLAAASLCSASALTPPDQLYLVGTFNSWQTPGSSNEYLLTDADQDGVYTGTFDLTGLDHLQFKIFTRVADWSETDAYFGASNYSYPMFSDRQLQIPVGIATDGYNSDIKISNWVPGTLEVSVKLIENDGSYSGELTMNGSNQEAMPAVPDKLYLVGAFNDWALPTEDALNGAIPMPDTAIDGALPFYGVETEIPAGEADFLIYFRDPATGEDKFIQGPPFRFTLCSEEPGYPGYQYFYTSISSSINTDHFVVRNWTGGKLRVAYNYFSPLTLVYWQNAPQADLPSPLYVVMESESGEDIYEVSSQWLEFESDMLPHKYTSFFFTSEYSVNPAPENIWGSDEDVMITLPNGTYTITRGGKPYALSGDARCSIRGYVNPSLGIIDVYMTQYPDYSNNEQIYLIGYLTGWLVPTEENKTHYEPYALPSTANGVYEGTFLMPAPNNQSAEFRFIAQFNSWNQDSFIGSGYEDFTYVPVFFDENGLYEGWLTQGGKGNWCLPSTWTEDNVTFIVDLNHNTVRMYQGGLGLEQVKTGNAEETYFNLQGQRVENPSNGIYIRLSEGKTSKVLVR